MDRQEILVAFGLGRQGALGNVWRITAKGTDFYLDPLGVADAVHLSAHGPNRRFPGQHRFHVKVAPRAAAAARARGHLLLHGLPPSGWPLEGEEIAPGAFRVARIRWTWDLQRPRFRAAAFSGPAPDIVDHQSGSALTQALSPNEAADVDVVVSYGSPHWPHAAGSLKDDARLGPLRNDADMWLTATSYRRSQMTHPAPAQVGVPRPRAGDVPNRILCGGPDTIASTYWFVETMTTAQAVREAL